MGTAAAENLIGGISNDILNGEGGEDTYHSGAGDDIIILSDLDFRLVDGGGGIDTLVLSGSNMVLDLSDRTVFSRITDIEIIDLNSGGNYPGFGTYSYGSNTLVLDQFSISSGTLRVNGDGQDTFIFKGGLDPIGTVIDFDIIYDEYHVVNGYAAQFSNDNRILVQSGIQVYYDTGMVL